MLENNNDTTKNVFDIQFLLGSWFINKPLRKQRITLTDWILSRFQSDRSEDKLTDIAEAFDERLRAVINADKRFLPIFWLVALAKIVGIREPLSQKLQYLKTVEVKAIKYKDRFNLLGKYDKDEKVVFIVSDEINKITDPYTFVDVEANKSAAISIWIHELIHFAIVLAYKNEALPFKQDNTDNHWERISKKINSIAMAYMYNDKLNKKLNNNLPPTFFSSSSHINYKQCFTDALAVLDLVYSDADLICEMAAKLIQDRFLHNAQNHEIFADEEIQVFIDNYYNEFSQYCELEIQLMLEESGLNLLPEIKANPNFYKIAMDAPLGEETFSSLIDLIYLEMTPRELYNEYKQRKFTAYNYDFEERSESAEKSVWDNYRKNELFESVFKQKLSVGSEFDRILEEISTISQQLMKCSM